MKDNYSITHSCTSAHHFIQHTFSDKANMSFKNNPSSFNPPANICQSGNQYFRCDTCIYASCVLHVLCTSIPAWLATGQAGDARINVIATNRVALVCQYHAIADSTLKRPVSQFLKTKYSPVGGHFATDQTDSKSIN